jgi:hypothetical protein
VQTYLLRRPAVAATAHQLDVALMRLRAFEESPAARCARWLHSYALRDADGRLGLACLFEADSIDSLQWHARITELPPSEILAVERTLERRPFAPTGVHLVRRRRRWATAADAERACCEGCLRSYVVREDDHTLGCICLCRFADLHATATAPADEITPVLGRVVCREPLLPSPP